jgi:hypothetical protein
MKNQLLKTALFCTTTLALASYHSHAATFATGYTPGSESQLLVANGGTGSTLLFDSAALGGSQDINANGGESFNSVLFPGAGLWSIGDTVTISGIALVLRSNTNEGTFTFDIRQAAGGTGASGAAGLASIATRTVEYVNPGAINVMWANFDTPVTFVADANSTTIGINFTNSGGTIGYKAGTELTDGLVRYNFSNGNIVGGANPSYQRWSIAGSVIPEPSSALLCLAGSLGLLRRRRA